MRSACEGSLRRLGTDHSTCTSSTGRTSAAPDRGDLGRDGELADDGLVRFIGVSNFDRDLIERCEAVRHVDTLQQEFSMLRLEDRDLIRWCGEQGTGVLSYGPLAYGLLTGAITSETRFDRGDFRGGDEEGGSLFAPGNRERNLALVEALRPIAERLAITLAQLALAWNVAQPGVTAAIAGSRNPDHVRSNAAAGDVVLDEATLSELDAIVSRAVFRVTTDRTRGSAMAYRRIVVATDGSASAETAEHVAATLAAAVGAKLTIAHAVREPRSRRRRRRARRADRRTRRAPSTRSRSRPRPRPTRS